MREEVIESYGLKADEERLVREAVEHAASSRRGLTAAEILAIPEEAL